MRKGEDVEGFIASSAFYAQTSGIGVPAVATEDLRAWMSGHVRVPVEPTEEMIEAGCKQHECKQQDPWYSNEELSEYDCKAIYKAMLNASKGE